MFALLRFVSSGWPAAVAAGLAFAAALAATGTAHSQTGSAIPPTAAPQPAVVGNVANAPGNDVQMPPAVKPADGAATIPANAPRVGPLPAGQVLADDYRIGAQDLLEIQVFGIDELKREVRVNSRGIISLPLIGPVVLAGLTSQDAETLIASKYAKDYLQDPQVSVFIKEFTSQRITLEGAVAKPGIYPIRGEITLMQAIALAGGQGQLPDLHEVLVYRREGGEKVMHTYDLDKIRAGEVEDPSLINEDIVVVKRAPGRVVLRDSFFGDLINILNPLNYLPRAGY
jgi:polysaccharide biosynthesis/export protein